MAVELQQHLDVWMDNVFVDADSSPTLTFRARSRETLGTNLEAFIEETEEDFAGEAGGPNGPEVITMSIEKGKQSASSNESRGSSRGSASSLTSKQNGAAQVGKPLAYYLAIFKWVAVIGFVHTHYDLYPSANVFGHSYTCLNSHRCTP